jgi:hypothetical protein
VRKGKDERPPGRFSKSGHTAHQPRSYPPYGPAGAPPPNYASPPSRGGPPDDGAPPPSGYVAPPPGSSVPPGYPHHPAGYPPPPPGHSAPPPAPPPGYSAPSGYGPPPPGYSEAAPDSGQPAQPGVRRAAATVGKATVVGTRAVTRKVITLSKSDGAAESGLTALVWNQVLSYGADAMVTVALAGTVFFGASAHAQRGNVLLYLLITMAPFAVVAPVIGPALDRLQHGRRWTMAGTAIGRAILALIMAAHSSDLLVLYPCALGSLVLSKAYGVVRAAAAPRLVPPNMTLTAANARVTIFGLGSTLVLGGFVGVLIKVTGSYTFGLIVTALGFVACAVFSFRLPPQVDSANAARRHPAEPPRAARQDKVPPLSRLVGWARRGFAPHLVVALQGEASLRLLTGFLAIYLAFYVESTSHGFGAAAALAGVIGGAGAGNFVGTALGHRLKTVRPQALVVGCVCVAAAATLLAAILFTMWLAIVAIFVGSATSALGKIALDSLIQNDVAEALRSSAFGRSETFLQLAWVLGAAIGVGLPSNGTGDGTIAFIVATVIVGAVALLVLLRNRAVNRLPHRSAGDTRPLGSVASQSLD